MDAKDFFDLKVQTAKGFGFPDPIFINASQLTGRTRVLYIVEVQATHIPDRKNNCPHHFALKFSKFKKIKEPPHWEDVPLPGHGFSISDKESINKLANYIEVNKQLLAAQLGDYSDLVVTRDSALKSILAQISKSPENRNIVFNLLKDEYPDIERKLLVYKLVQARRRSLEEFRQSMADPSKNEQNFWQAFLENNRWMFGVSYSLLLDDRRIDLENIADYLVEAEDGFLDIIEIKHPHVNFWLKDRSGNYSKYRDFLQPDGTLTGAITQASNYIFQIEKKFTDPDWQRLHGGKTPVKPTCTIIHGRSDAWGFEERTSFRLLNDSLHGIKVITFDHLFNRAKRLLETLESET